MKSDTNSPLSIARMVTYLFLFQTAFGIALSVAWLVLAKLAPDVAPSAHFGIVSFIAGSFYYAYWQEKKCPNVITPFIKKIALYISLINVMLAGLFLCLLVSISGKFAIAPFIIALVFLSGLLVIMYFSCYFSMKSGIRWRYKELKNRATKEQ